MQPSGLWMDLLKYGLKHHGDVKLTNSDETFLGRKKFPYIEMSI